LGGRKGIWPVKTEWWGAGVVICLERGADLHKAQLMTLPLTVSCFSKIQIGFTFLDFTEARDSEWQWHQLGHMQVCTALQRDSHASTPPLSFLQAGCPSCHPTSSVKALKANTEKQAVSKSDKQ